MASPQDMEIIDNHDAVRLLINVYLIKKVKSRGKPVNLKKFLDNVRREFKNRNYNYPRKRILFTWKQLLDNYQFYKEKFTDADARKMWSYFDLMDNCFDDLKHPSSEKFADPRWTFFLIESLNKYKQTILQQGLTMDVLEALEDEFRNENNYNINQKDIYNQWIVLKRCYRQNQKTGKHLTKNDMYFPALKSFFEDVAETVESSTKNDASESELVSAIESITEHITESKRRKMDTSGFSVLPKKAEKIVSENTPTQFTIVMHDILLQCFKKHKAKIQALKGSLDESILQEAFREFYKLGYNVTRDAISNEWNDLSYRYELIKSTEHPEKWPYYSDMSYIYDKSDDDEAYLTVSLDNQSTIGSIIMENVRRNANLKSDDYVKLTDRLLNVYEANSKEFLEIKDTLAERNLLREETNYLLSMLVKKVTNKTGAKNLPEGDN